MNYYAKLCFATITTSTSCILASHHKMNWVCKALPPKDLLSLQMQEVDRLALQMRDARSSGGMHENSINYCAEGY